MKNPLATQSGDQAHASPGASQADKSLTDQHSAAQSSAAHTSEIQGPAEFRVVLVGNPNCGKSSLFNALTGLRAKVANYPGITVDLREAHLLIASPSPVEPSLGLTIVDLPGLYGLEPTSPEERVASEAVANANELHPDVVLVVLEATNLSRGLFLASEILQLDRPTLIALNMIDEAESHGLTIDVQQLEHELGCPIVAVSARTGQGLSDLRQQLASTCRSTLASPTRDPDHKEKSPCQLACAGCSCGERHAWARTLTQLSVKDPRPTGEKIGWGDRILTSPIMGFVALLTVMLGVFFLIFSLADLPMSLIEGAFGVVGEWISELLPEQFSSSVLKWTFAFTVSLLIAAFVLSLGRFKFSTFTVTVSVIVCGLLALLPQEDFYSLLLDGVLAGVAGVVVFLPQICILFFFITLLEDSGYLARGAFVMERVMRHVGLPGKAFVPMLSAHACAIPGIMATRTIESWRDRLVTILVLPLLTCSARLPVYAMVAALLFGESPWLSALMFAAAYLLGLVAALGTAWFLKRTVVPGKAAPLVIELPPYRVPSLRNALLTVVDRASVFLKKAGSLILLISIVLWGLASYPKPGPTATTVAPNATQLAVGQLDDSGKPPNPADVSPEETRRQAQFALEYSFAGRLGKLFEPIFSPLGFDWKINVGVISSFAAREVVVSTLSIIYGLGEDGVDDQAGLVETLRRQTRPDGSPVFDVATSLSLLVFYVLAMQCLPTQAVTKRETGSWKWAVFQLVYMTLLAYVAALVVYEVAVRVT